MRVHELVLLVATCAVCFNFGRSGTGGRPEKHNDGRNGSRSKVKELSESVHRKMNEFRERLCGYEDAIEEELTLSAQETKELQRELKLLERRSNTVRLKPGKNSIEEINTKAGVASSLYQGDMVLSREQQEEVFVGIGGGRSKRQAYNDKSYPGRRWSNGVFYSLDGSLDNKTKEVFEKAAQLWMDNTCIDFKKDEEEKAEDLLVVIKEYGCWSEVGRQGEWQFLSLGKNCDQYVARPFLALLQIGIAAHEIGHALGFWHTHSRYDRNQFVKVLKKNVEPDQLYQYVKETRKTNNNYNLTYDYGSVMHYKARSFIKTEALKEGKYTMISKDVAYMETMGSNIIGFYDLLMMNIYYNCTDACKGVPTRCFNGGFVNPRKCSKCICPSGYGGRFCNRRPPGCGSVHHATRDWKILEDKLELNGSKAGPDGFLRCNYWIRAPAGKRIEVKVEEVPALYGYDGCINAGVEIKTHPDQRRTGYRFCLKSSVGTTLTSNSSTVPVITFILESLFQIEQLPDDYYDEEYMEETEENRSVKEHKDEDENKLTTGVKLKYRHL